MKFKCFSALLVLLICATSGHAQIYKANEFIRKGNFEEAAFILESATAKGIKDNTSLINLAYCYIKMHDYGKAEQTYVKITGEKRIDKSQYFYYGEVLRFMGKFNEAKEQYNKYLELFPGDFLTIAAIRSCDSLLIWKDQSTGAIVVNAKEFNTEKEELWPAITDDGLFYISNNMDLLVKTGDTTEFMNPKITFIYHVKDGQTSVFRPFADSITYLSYSRKDGKSAMVVKEIRNTVDGLFMGKSVIKISDDDKVWKDFMPAEIPDGYISNHPCFAKNGTRIYFASDIPGGFGGSDLYYSDYSDGSWKKPVNLGEIINTPGNEMAPFVTEKEDILYFASDGHAGYGNLDVFSAVAEGNGWSLPRNMRAPINSVGNDFGFVCGDNPYQGYFVSNRYGVSLGGNDIYTFGLPEPVVIPDTVAPPVVETVPGDTSFVFFETARWVIDPVFSSELDSIAEILKKQPYLKLNVISWADVRGTDMLNANICNERALALKKWFANHGVDSSRIVSKPSGVSSKSGLPKLVYHVQLGCLSRPGQEDYYRGIIRQEVPVNSCVYEGKYYYYAGRGSFAEMKELESKLKTTYKVVGLVAASYSNYYLPDLKYAPNRRVDMYFTK